ncbi:MAG: glycosyltransferase family 2 protein [Candidatus Microsaccharimonas sp.]
MTSVLVVVLNWNGIEDTKECLDSLFQQTYKDFQVAVVDNGSVDDSLAQLKPFEKAHSNLVVLKNSKNLGFDGGVNTGIKYAIKNGFDAVALFNNDAIANEDWLKKLVPHLKGDIGIVTGLLLHRDGKTIDTTGDFYTTWGVPSPRYRGSSSDTIPESGYVFGASGGASLYSITMLKTIGLFDETFFAYYEDVDISFRAQLAGFKVFYTKDAIAYHKQGATSSKIPGFTVYQTFKNLPLLFWKNVPLELLVPIGARFLLVYTLIFGNAVKNRSGWPALKGWLASIWYFWVSALWLRFAIQRNKKVSSAYIDSILYHDIPPEQTGMRKFRQFFTRITGE